MEQLFGWLTKHGAALRNLAILAVAASLAVFLYADFRFGPVRASAWFQGEAVILALVALVAAGLAAVFTYPSYREWWREQQRHPAPSVSIEVGPPGLETPVVIADGDHLNLVATQARFEVRVAIINEGTGTLRNALVNICVLTTCRIEPIDDGRIFHHLMPGTAQNNVIVPGQVERVRATMARDDFPPGIRMFHVAVTAPMDEAVPIIVALAGEGMEPLTSRVTVKVSPS